MKNQENSSTGYLERPGAKVYYETKGTGPALVIIPGANGNAPVFAPIREFLYQNFKVITYDRRGFSHSTLDADYGFKDKLSDDADDVAALIEHLSDDGTAYVMGSSSGAIVALKTLQKHPDRIKMLVPHEPPAIDMYDEPEKSQWASFFRDVEQTYKTQGVAPAMKQFAEGNIDEKDAAAMQHVDTDPNSETAKNTRFWFDHELPFYPYTRWITADFKPFREKMLPAVGLASRGYFTELANLQLSKDLGLEILAVPSGHLGYAFCPQQFAETLTKALLK